MFSNGRQPAAPARQLRYPPATRQLRPFSAIRPVPRCRQQRRTPAAPQSLPNLTSNPEQDTRSQAPDGVCRSKCPQNPARPSHLPVRMRYTEHPEGSPARVSDAGNLRVPCHHDFSHGPGDPPSCRTGGTGCVGASVPGRTHKRRSSPVILRSSSTASSIPSRRAAGERARTGRGVAPSPAGRTSRRQADPLIEPPSQNGFPIGTGATGVRAPTPPCLNRHRVGPAVPAGRNRCPGPDPSVSRPTPWTKWLLARRC